MTDEPYPEVIGDSPRPRPGATARDHVRDITTQISPCCGDSFFVVESLILSTNTIFTRLYINDTCKIAGVQQSRTAELTELGPFLTALILIIHVINHELRV